jgi:hypothetical protein
MTALKIIAWIAAAGFILFGALFLAAGIINQGQVGRSTTGLIHV